MGRWRGGEGGLLLHRGGGLPRESVKFNNSEGVFTFFTRATWEGELGESIPQLLLLLVLIGLAAIIVATPLLLEKAPKITIALLIKETMSFQQQFQIICGKLFCMKKLC